MASTKYCDHLVSYVVLFWVIFLCLSLFYANWPAILEKYFLLQENNV